MSKIMELAQAWRLAEGLASLAARAKLNAEVERLESRLADYDKRLSEVMPPDFKDWHENSRSEWPEIAAMVIANLRSEVAALREDAERYRWLRDSAFACFWFGQGGLYPRTGLDAAIDKDIDNARSTK